MKKTYVKPTLDRREKLSQVAAAGSGGGGGGGNEVNL